jgi:glycerophosphoryl diester phosphodiesterase
VALGVRRLTAGGRLSGGTGVADDVRVPTAATPQLHRYLQVSRPFVLAHRGLATSAPENSMAAFAAAVDLGVTHLETDVHATADGELVVFHDATLERLTDLRGPVRAVSWAVLRNARLADGERVPRLADVLDAWPEVRINVDLKSGGAVQPFVELIGRRRALERVCVASFSDRRRRTAVRALAGSGRVASSLGLRGSLTAVALASGGAPVPVLRAALQGAVALQLPDAGRRRRVVTRRLVDAVHAAGAQVHVWTVDDPGRMRELVGLGVDAIVTNRADLALAALGGVARPQQGPQP